jgi:hypothetical protein
LLWDPGAFVTGSSNSSTFQVSGTDQGQAASFTYKKESPNGGATGSTISISGGTITVAPYVQQSFPDSVIVITSSTPIDGITVTANTIPYDFWGLTLPTTSAQGIDFQNAAALTATQIKQAGFGFVMNYLGTTSSNYLTAAEADSDIAAGLQICSIYEVTYRNGTDYNPNVAGNIPGYFGSCLDNNGYTDGTNAYNYAHNVLNQSAGSAIYFAIDADTANSSAYMADVVSYFQGIAQAFSDLSGGDPLYTIGVYGDGDVLNTIYNDGLAKYKWLADAPGWAGSNGYTNYTIEQFDSRDTSTFPSVSIDHDATIGSSFGQWGPTSAVTPAKPSDFIGDGTSDVLWYNATDGSVGDWLMSNGQPQWQFLSGSLTSWQIQGAGNFTGAKTSDVLWRNTSTGQVLDWVMNNNQPQQQILGYGSTTMNVAGVGDFNGDGTSDILWQNPTNNLVGEWQMNNNVPTWELVAQGSTTMNIAGIGDFNGGGKSDILWENPTNNLVGMWAMNGAQATWSLLDQGSTTMNIVGVGDFTGNGTDDILWENPSNGVVGFWGMTNSQVTSWNVVATANTAYQVAGIGDYYGNGTDDILWRNASTGDVGVWAMNNGQATWHDLGLSSTSFNPVKA